MLHDLIYCPEDFIANMDKYMPDWKDKKNLLNEQILDSYKA